MPKRKPLESLEWVKELPLALQHGEPELNAPIAQTFRRAGGELLAAFHCETFPQACRALLSGGFAAVLPTVARDELDEADIEEVRVPALRAAASRISLAWHPRLARRRPSVAAWADRLARALKLEQ